MKTLKGFILTAAAATALSAAPVWAQATATVHGHVINPAGVPQAGGLVEFTAHDLSVEHKNAKVIKSAPVDQSGSYSVSGLPAGDYFMYVTLEGKDQDRIEVAVKAGDDKTVDDDMTRDEYMKSLTPERRKEIEEYKKKNSEASAANKVINNLNATLKAVRDDLHSASPNYDKDMADMKSATEAKPDEGVLWMTYGDAMAAKADHLAAEDKKAGKPAMSDADVIKNYDDAVAAYKKGVDLNAASKKPNPVDQATSYNQMGTALAHEGKINDSLAAYDNAAKIDPTHAGLYYNNAAAVTYNASQSNASLNDGVLSLAEKAIAADPNRPDPYYIKGQMLLQKATLDPKTQKLVTPPGCVDAYQHYLSLAPDGKYAQSVKEVLAQLGEKVDTHYRAPGKR